MITGNPTVQAIEVSLPGTPKSISVEVIYSHLPSSSQGKEARTGGR